MTQTQTTLLTVAEVAAITRLSRDAIRDAIKQGKLTAIDTTHGGRRPNYRITREALDDFLRRGTTSPPPKVERRKRRPVERKYFA